MEKWHVNTAGESDCERCSEAYVVIFTDIFRYSG